METRKYCLDFYKEKKIGLQKQVARKRTVWEMRIYKIEVIDFDMNAYFSLAERSFFCFENTDYNCENILRRRSAVFMVTVRCSSTSFMTRLITCLTKLVRSSVTRNCRYRPWQLPDYNLELSMEIRCVVMRNMYVRTRRNRACSVKKSYDEE